MKTFSLLFNNKKIIIEIGEVAKQASGSVIVKFNDTVVLSTVCYSKIFKEDFILNVNYEEKQYSVGKIPGTFSRRENQTEHSILSARLIDRAIRPRFNVYFNHEIQVINTVLSYDENASPEIASLIGTSLALSISEIPFDGPIAGVKIAKINNQLIINPSLEQQKQSILDLIVTGDDYAINMVEAGAFQISEQEILDALKIGHQEIKKICRFQKEIIAQVGSKSKVNLNIPSEKFKQNVISKINQKVLNEILINHFNQQEEIEKFKQNIISQYENQEYQTESEKINTLFLVKNILELIISNEIKKNIVKKKMRFDGRKMNEIRLLNAKINILPRTHGSAIFTRGQTQVISTTTLGTLDDKQIIDNLTHETSKYFIHHYNFPPYAVGEVGKISMPKRREIGHGKLCEKALNYVIPDINEFPYTIRVVSDVVESNGSSSQASICAGCLSLMSAGVPIKAMVSGIAMGLFTYGDQYVVLTDIQGLEDHYGEMDFKVAGTNLGITALQMDIKTKGITYQILQESLAQAKKAREQILIFMKNIISKPSQKLSLYAVKAKKININANKISELIGHGGKNINNIINCCDNCKIDIQDNGEIIIYHFNEEMIEKAINMIKEITKEINIGDILVGKVIRIENYGIFVNLFGNINGFCHISQFSSNLIKNVNDFVNINDKLKFKVIEIDDKGRINLSLKF